MGGAIGVESTGTGSTFWFTARFGFAATTLSCPRNLVGVRVLVVDDHPVNRLALEQQLRFTGADVQSIASPHEAIGAMTGVDLAILIRGTPGIDATKLALFTSADLTATAPAARAAGVDLCLGKPVRQAHMLRAVATLTGRTNGLAQPTVGPEAVLPPVKSTLRILVAEDNVVNQKVAVRMLQKLGCTVEVAANGVEALAALAERPFDLAFMDCQMPEMDGFEATGEQRRREAAGARPRIPIVALTANAMQGDRERCLEAGMDDHITKPVTLAALQAVRERVAGSAAPAATA